MEEQGLRPQDGPPDGGNSPDSPDLPDLPDESGYTGGAVPPRSGDDSPGGRAGLPPESPSIIRNFWPVVLLIAISAATLIVAAAAPRPPAPPAETQEGKEAPSPPREAGGQLDEGTDEKVDEKVDEALGGEPAEKDEEPAGLGGVVFLIFDYAFLGAGMFCLLLLLDRRTRRWLLPPPREAPRATWGPEQFFYGFLLAFGALVLASAIVALVPEDFVIIGSLVQASGQLAIGAIIVALVVTRPTAFPHLFAPPEGFTPAGSARERLASLGISGRDAGTNILRGTVAVVATFPLAMGAAWLGRLLQIALTGEEPGLHPVIKQVMEAGPLEVAALMGLACVAVPLCEEVFFRGFLYPSIRDKFGVAVGVVVSSLIFGMVHPGLPNQMVVFVLGVSFCLIYERSGTLVAPIVAHAFFNAVSLVSVLALRTVG